MSFIQLEHSMRHGALAAPFAAKTRASKAPSETGQDLGATIARLRGFAMLLCLDVDVADRLVEVTLLRASAGMTPSALGIRNSAWLCARLRSYFYHEYANPSAAGSGHETASPAKRPALQDAVADTLLPALAKLSVHNREALVLTDAAGFSAREAARICSCPLPLFQARLERARLLLRFALPKRAAATGSAPVLSATILRQLNIAGHR